MLGFIERTMFKRVPNGYVLQPRRLLALGRGDRYLVSDAQKGEIIARVGLSRMLGIQPAFAGALLALVMISAIWFLSDHSERTIGSSILTFAVVAFAQIVCFEISDRLMLRKLRPLLHDLPRTEDRITALDVWDLR